jgi:hypothetical protein
MILGKHALSKKSTKRRMDLKWNSSQAGRWSCTHIWWDHKRKDNGGWALLVRE